MQDNIKQIFSGCQRIIGLYSGRIGDKIYSGPLRCNDWNCPTCFPKKKSKLKYRVFHGPMYAEPVAKHGIKFLTLTFGGKEAREPFLLKNQILKSLSIENSGNDDEIRSAIYQDRYDTVAMYELMMNNFKKLIDALRDKYCKSHKGTFKYIRVFETHQDGVPHLHVLFVGRAIVPKSFHASITKLWCKDYGMGFIKLNSIKDKNGRVVTQFQDVQHAINYMFKYLTKDIQKPGPNKRVFSCSQNTLLKTEKRTWDIMQVIFGQFDDNGNLVEELIGDWDLQEILAGKLKKIAGGKYDFNSPDISQAVMNRHLNYLSRKIKGETEDDCKD